VLRNGVKHGAYGLTLFYGAPSRGNTLAAERNAANRFTVVRQLHFSPTATALSLDVCLMINGLPVVTMELKNKLTKQSVRDAVEQYKNDRSATELVFAFKRAIVHLAVDDQQVEFCTKLDGKASWFLPFNQGFNDGAGNPPNPNGVMTSYLWENILTRESLTGIIENYAQVIVEEAQDRKTKKTRKREAQREEVPHSALGRQREVKLDRVAGASARRAGTRRRQVCFCTSVRLGDRGDEPPDS